MQENLLLIIWLGPALCFWRVGLDLVSVSLVGCVRLRGERKGV